MKPVFKFNFAEITNDIPSDKPMLLMRFIENQLIYITTGYKQEWTDCHGYSHQQWLNVTDVATDDGRESEIFSDPTHYCLID